MIDILSPLNSAQLPYALGFRVFNEIEQRMNQGGYSDLAKFLSGKSVNDGEKGLDQILNVVKYSTDWEFIFSFLDKAFLKKYVKEIFKNQSAIYGIEYDLTAEDEEYIEDIADNFRMRMLLRTGNYKPIVYIPKGKGNFRGGLLLEQDFTFLSRYVGVKDAELEETIKENSGFLTMNNHETHNALMRIAKVYGRPVTLKTIDENKGTPILIRADKDKVDISEFKQ